MQCASYRCSIMFKIGRHLSCIQCNLSARAGIGSLVFRKRIVSSILHCHEYSLKNVRVPGCRVVSHQKCSESFPRTLSIVFIPGSENPSQNFSTSVATSFLKTVPSSSLFSRDKRSYHARSSPSSAPRYEQNKESAVLREYGRTYSPNKRYTKRQLEDQETDEDDEQFRLEKSDDSDLKPEDMFGTMANKYEKEFHVEGDVFDLEVDSDDDGDKTDQAKPPGRRNTPIWYGNQMKKLVKEGKLMEAIDMLEVRMLKEDHVQPVEFNYDVLIGACGREGYTKKAFTLYNQMKKRGLTPSALTFTSLFNACAESPWPLTDGITRLRHLHSQLKDKGITVNKITHHAMIKAYAKCGDLRMAFDLFRDLLTSGAEVTSQSFAFLFFACAGDKERGLLYAIEAWRQMRQRGIKPDIYTYNLLLRIVRDCGIGDPEVASDILLKHPAKEQNEMLPAPKRNKKGHKTETYVQKSQESKEEMVSVRPLEVIDEKQEMWFVSDQANASTSLVSQVGQVPNLLDLSADVSQVKSLTSLSTPSDRLALLGGAQGILGSMRKYKVIPNVKSLTLMMESLPMSTQDEENILKTVDEFKVKVDVDLYNAIIRRRSRRADLEGAKAILPLIQQKGLFPNQRTFVNLACECSRAKDGIQLLKDMKLAGLQPSVYIYGALLTAAARRWDYGYQIELLRCMEKDQVTPDERILKVLENTAAFGQTRKKDGLSKRELYQQTKLNHFRAFYTKWLDQMAVQKTPHPWERFYRPRGEAVTPRDKE